MGVSISPRRVKRIETMVGRTRDDERERTRERAKDLFANLANETRIEILFALAEAERAEGRSVAFSRIYDRLDIRDSSKFNYHLKMLTENLVRRTDDGYELRYVGRLIYRAIKAGEFVDEEVLEPTRIDSECARCGETLTAQYVDGRLLVSCEACSDIAYRITVPPAALADRTPEEFLRAADQQIRSDITLAANRVCSYCSGKTTPSLSGPTDGPTDNVYVDHRCEHCRQRVLSTTIGELFLSHPLVVAFCIERGVDLTATPCWEIDFCVTDEFTSVVAEDPWRVRFEYPIEGETLQVTLDDRLETVAHSIEDREDS